jgi:uncharacterized protein
MFSEPSNSMSRIATTGTLAFAALLVLIWCVGAASKDPGVTSSAIEPSVWSMKRWSPYAAGIGIGILSWFTFLLSDNTLGASGSYATTAGMIERILRGSKVKEKTYYREHPPEIGWGWMLLVGIVVGAFISAKLSGDFHIEIVPSLWERTVGEGVLLRVTVAFIGGLLLGIGSRWADGCTSGHGISGTLQLVASSWLAVICFFVGGVGTALTIF